MTDINPYDIEAVRRGAESFNGEGSYTPEKSTLIKSRTVKTVEERLREKKIQGYDVYDVKELDFDAELQDLIRLSDALEITKDLFTKEQVNELLKKQREICNREAKVRYTYKKVGLNKQCKIFRSSNSEEYYVDEATILNAPSPSLEGEKK